MGSLKRRVERVRKCEGEIENGTFALCLFCLSLIMYLYSCSARVIIWRERNSSQTLSNMGQQIGHNELLSHFSSMSSSGIYLPTSSYFFGTFLLLFYTFR
jgi:hypothetical protein